MMNDAPMQHHFIIKGWIGRANPLMDREVIRVVLIEVFAVVASATTAGCSVVHVVTSTVAMHLY